MKVALKYAEYGIIVAGYSVYTTVRKDLRGDPDKEAMLSDAWRPNSSG